MDTKYMRITNDYSDKKENYITKLAYHKCYEQYFDRYLVGEELKTYIAKRKNISILQAEAFLSNDMKKLTFAEIEAYKLKERYENSASEQKFDIESIVVSVEKGLGFMIDRKKMSVDTFYKHLTIFVSNGKKDSK